MNYRRFGRTDWQVSEIGHGMWGMGGWTGKAGGWTGSDDGKSLKALHRSVELGINFFDTAWIYGEGHSEKLLGKLLRAYPNKKIYIATKIPPKNFIWPAKPDDKLEDIFPEKHIIEYAQMSLKNLGTDHIDLLQFHVWEDTWATNEHWQKAVTKLKQQGIVQAVGVSVHRWEPENVLTTLKTGLIDSVQVIYNIFDQAPEDQLFPLCRKLDLGVIARVPFDEGSLTGRITRDTKWPEGDFRSRYFGHGNLGKTVERVEKLQATLPKGMLLPELALRFILSNPQVSTTIPGMRQVKNIEANVAASDQGPLNPEIIKKLRSHRWDRKTVIR